MAKSVETIDLTPKQRGVLEWRLNNMCFRVIGEKIYIDETGKKKDFYEGDIIAFITNGDGAEYHLSFNPKAHFPKKFYKSIRETCRIVKYI